GYSIETLAEQATFEEVAYLILRGELPNAAELKAFRSRLAEVRDLPAPIVQLLHELPENTSMMDVMRTGASALAHWDSDVADNSHDANLRKAERLLVQMPMIMAACHRIVQDKEPVMPNPELSLAGNVLWMLFREPPTPRSTRAMDVSLILYAEHEYNASTFTA